MGDVVCVCVCVESSFGLRGQAQLLDPNLGIFIVGRLNHFLSSHLFRCCTLPLPSLAQAAQAAYQPPLILHLFNSYLLQGPCA